MKSNHCMIFFFPFFFFFTKSILDLNSVAWQYIHVACQIHQWWFTHYYIISVFVIGWNGEHNLGWNVYYWYLFTLLENVKSFVNPGFWMTVGEDSVQYRKRKKALLLSSRHFVFYRLSYYNLMASVIGLEALFLDVTSYALNNCSF